MAAPMLAGKISHADWLKLGETNQPCGIVDRDLRMSPAPNVIHQRQVRRRMLFLQPFVPEERGELLPSPIDVIVSRSPLRVRQPDIVVILFREDG